MTTPESDSLVTAKKQRGRPSSYTPEAAAMIFERLAMSESLKAICRDPGTPSEGAVLNWVKTRPDFRRQYDLGRECGREMICDEVLDIADNLWRRNSPDALQDARREIDAKKWHLARMTPRRRTQPVTGAGGQVVQDEANALTMISKG